MIQIKRLKQAGSEFVPITLAEAVVVNTENIAGFSEQITTLDKVLGQYCGLTGYAITAIENINNNLINNYQKKLTAGIGITITDDGVISASFTPEQGLSYKISLSGLPDPSKDCLNNIYLVPSDNAKDNNLFDEYICYENEGDYYWERIGSIPSTVSFDNLVTREEFEEYIASSITSVPVRNSSGKDVEIEIDLSKIGELYDDY